MGNSIVVKYIKKNWKHEVVRACFIAIIFAISILPLFFLLGNIKGNDLNFIFKDNNFYKSVGNSFLYSFVSSVISVLLSLVVAYFLNFSSIKHKKALVVLLSMPMLVPTLSIGLGIRVSTGTNGFFDQLFGISTSLIGMGGLIVGSVIVSFPPTFLVIYDSLNYENKDSYDAATIMGISKFSQFFRITIPFLIKPLITAFFACFTLIFSDYGIPMEVAGKIQTLPMYLYNQAQTSFEYGRAAFVGLILLVPALLSFIFDIFLKEDKGDTYNKQIIKPSLFFNILSTSIVVLVAFFLFIPQLSFVSLTFMKGYPNNIQFSFDNLAGVFDAVHGVGLVRYIMNSLLISVLTGVFGTILAYIIAFFTCRIEGKLAKILNFAIMATIAIPGIVLGIGYIFLFKDTKGVFYGTFIILVVVNVAHFIGSPFIMAKNCLSKINKDYEIIGNTLGISKFKILLRVLIPSSVGTIIEMFSYLFLNSMITISAVSFLCTYNTQPLSVLITTYERTGNYEMQAVVSFLIISLNVIFKGMIGLIRYIVVGKVEKRKEKEYMQLNRYQFSILTFLEKEGKGKYSQRRLSNELRVSLGTVNKELNVCVELGFIQIDAQNNIELTEKGFQVLEPYKVRKAIIIAAGFGSRMAPVTLDTPKPLVKVNGVRIIDTIIDSLVDKGITNIIIVRGYKKEQFDQLLEKYPFIKFVDNNEYNVTNNISSVMKALDYIDRCYICEADLIVSNKDIFNKYEFKSNYLGIRVTETDDWCFKEKNGYIDGFAMGGEKCYQMIGISYWNEEDSKKLKEAIQKLYNSRAGKENYWDAAPLRNSKKDFKIEIRDCLKTDVVEIDNFSELVSIDSSYKDYKDHDKY